MTKRLLAAAVVAAGAVLASGTASAELFGLQHGRSANPASMDTMSVEGGITRSSDLFTIGGRFNYKLNDNLTIYGDLGHSEYDYGWYSDADGFSIGGGVYYFLDNQRFTDFLDMAFHGSLHMAQLEGSRYRYSSYYYRSGDMDYMTAVFDMLVSPVEPVLDNGFSWYASAGLGHLRMDPEWGPSDDSIELLASGGITLPLGPGELFAGGELFDEVNIGAGYRYGF
ncbi:MAG: hypothetical protein CSB44_00405 [Gammaproteobacteria bacterium]|nr:MAG: hypothetical protein CSB44_00405 [Gammaproteobacteria bacterium]